MGLSNCWIELFPLGIILSLGFLLIISLVLDSAVIAFREYLFVYFDDAAVVLVQLAQLLFLLFLLGLLQG